MDVLLAALKAVDPYRAVMSALGELQQTGDLPAGHIYVLGAGKAGATMSRACEDALGDRITAGLVIVKEGHADTGGGAPLKRIELAEAGHPIPDDRGARATSRLLQMADEADQGDLVLCLISGGGSALLTAPAEDLSLHDVQATTGLLLRAGATINELNAVRKHLSQASGGQLARRAHPARVISLILSDVIGSPLDVIASGPTAPDPTTYRDALRVLETQGLSESAPPSVLRHLKRGAAGEVEETPKPGDPLFSHLRNILLASNVTAVEAAAARAREMGLNALVGSTYIEGEATEVGVVLAGIAKEIAAHGRPVSRPGCVLFGGETTVTVRGEGTGGRNSELALSAAIALDGWGTDLLIASLATDGGDGPSPGAGAIADGTALQRGKALGLDAHDFLANNDSYTYWSRLGDAIETGPTGTNVNDVMGVFVL